MIFFQRDTNVIVNGGEVLVLCPLQILLHLLMQYPLIAFQRNDVIGFLVHNFLPDLFLTPHRIYRYHTTFQVQDFQ